jgi:hypothetical protein
MVNPLHKRVVAIALVFATIALCPPYRHGNGDAAGYGLIFYPPETKFRSIGIDTTRLAMSLTALAILTLAGVACCGRRFPESQGARLDSRTPKARDLPPT